MSGWLLKRICNKTKQSRVKLLPVCLTSSEQNHIKCTTSHWISVMRKWGEDILSFSPGLQRETTWHHVMVYLVVKECLRCSNFYFQQYLDTQRKNIVLKASEDLFSGLATKLQTKDWTTTAWHSKVMFIRKIATWAPVEVRYPTQDKVSSQSFEREWNHID